jgi:hypothetical protein
LARAGPRGKVDGVKGFFKAKKRSSFLKKTAKKLLILPHAGPGVH